MPNEISELLQEDKKAVKQAFTSLPGFQFIHFDHIRQHTPGDQVTDTDTRACQDCQEEEQTHLPRLHEEQSQWLPITQKDMPR